MRSLKSEGEAYWNTKMRDKWDALVEFSHVDTDDIVIGNGVVGQHGLIIETGGVVVNSLVVIAENLPSTDPGLNGQLWNDAGTLKVSAG